MFVGQIPATQLTANSHSRCHSFTQLTHPHMPPHFTQHLTRTPARISRCHRAKNVSTYDTINKNTLLIRRPPFFALNVIITLALLGPKRTFLHHTNFTVTSIPAILLSYTSSTFGPQHISQPTQPCPLPSTLMHTRLGLNIHTALLRLNRILLRILGNCTSA